MSGSKKIPAMFRVTSQTDHTVSLGDGIYNATERTAAGTLVIPDSIVLDSITFRLTALADNALTSCSGITALSLPHGLERIGSAALQGCSAIAQLTLPTAVQTIGDKAFAGCSQLRYIDMRQATSIAADTIAAGNGMLEQLPENTIVYAPKGFTKTGGNNVIATDTTGGTHCSTSTSSLSRLVRASQTISLKPARTILPRPRLAGKRIERVDPCGVKGEFADDSARTLFAEETALRH